MVSGRAGADQPPQDIHKGIHFYFSKCVNFIDNNLRVLQYSLYCVGGFGLLYSLHSLRVFSRFQRITDIPDEFIKNHVKLQGVVVSTFSESPTLRAAQKFNKQVAICSPSADRTTVSCDLHKIAAPEEANMDFPSFGNPFLEEENISPLYVKVQHVPIFNLRWNRSAKIHSDISLKLAGIQVKKNYLQKISENLSGERIWFRILRHDNANDVLVCTVKLKGTWFESYNLSLVKLGYANVESYDESLCNVKYYKKLYKKLLKQKETLEKSKRRNWFRRLTEKILIRKSSK